MIIARYSTWLIEGLSNTLSLVVCTWVVGTFGGTLVGCLALLRPCSIGACLQVLSTILAATPVLVSLLFLHYPAQQLLGISIEPFYTALITLSLYNSIGVGNLLVEGFSTLSKGYLEIAKTLRLTPFRTLRYVTVPLLLRQLLPGIILLQIQVIHLSMFTSLISVNELFRQIQRINMKEYDPISTYGLLAAFYLGISLPMLLLVRQLKLNWIKRSGEVAI
jgi:His/Glu/Gln/Arg/opine family amino acid ABC transporter permease subunit